MRGRTGHENKTRQRGEHLIAAFTPTLSSRLSMWPSFGRGRFPAFLSWPQLWSMPPWTDRCGPIMRTDGVRVVPAVCPKEVRVAWQSSRGAAQRVGYTAESLENMALHAAWCSSTCVRL